MSTKKIFVTGATGQQGGAVARHLLKQPGFAVRALTRDAEKTAARALAQAGAELVQGDLDDPSSYRKALEGAYGVFSVQGAMEAGYDAEVRQGKALAEAAKAAGVQHFVYSSVVSASEHTGIPHFESKWEIEQHLHGLEIPFTILRPVFFMQNWHNYLREPILHGALPLPLSPQTPLQQVSIEDIGGFARLVLQTPAKWLGKTVELAGDEVTMVQMASLLSRTVGQRVSYVQVPWEQFRQNAGEEMTRMYRWFEDVGYHVDIAALRRDYPSFATVEQVLRRQDWRGTEASAREAA
ncbi:MAG TPA: NmrA/HSCARG family protein [Candidatus Acidoferrum sp.]|nr:NmrA/HSCARG family protein [Candidatus Acidoferrum sp.]